MVTCSAAKPPIPPTTRLIFSLIGAAVDAAVGGGGCSVGGCSGSPAIFPTPETMSIGGDDKECRRMSLPSN